MKASVIQMKLTQKGVYEMKTQTVKKALLFTKDLLFKNFLKYGLQSAMMFAVGMTIVWALAPVFFGWTLISPTAMILVWTATVGIAVFSMMLDAIFALDPLTRIQKWFKRSEKEVPEAVPNEKMSAVN